MGDLINGAEMMREWEGVIERLSSSSVAGWVRARESNDPVTVEILRGGKSLGRVLADEDRHDLRHQGKGSGRHGFVFEFARPLRHKREVEVRVFGSDFMLPHIDLVVPAAAKTPRLAEVTGYIDEVNDNWIIGWAWVAEGQQRIGIEARIADAVVASARADVARVDLQAAGIGDGCHGFELYLPLAEFYRDGGTLHLAGGGLLTDLTHLLREKTEWYINKQPADRPSIEARNAATDLMQLSLPASATNGQESPRPVDRAKRLTVVAWDMGHNPVGRAYALADMMQETQRVELVGPCSPAFGGRLWQPIEGTKLAKRQFPASNLRALVQGALDLANSTSCDAVIVGKPRLASLLIGALIRHVNKCPMVLDIDDYELSFVKEQSPLDFDGLEAALALGHTDSSNPHGDLWTRFAETLVGEADAITVSNPTLAQKFGGMVVRHARDETVFDPSLCDRAAIRAEFGYTNEDCVILFLGTVRAHKGILELCESLRRVAIPHLAVCIIGDVTDAALARKIAAFTGLRISMHPDQPWDRIPALVGMADGVVLLQDTSHPTAQYQMPAKLTDALAMNVPVIATPVPPLRDAALSGLLHQVSNAADLDDALRLLAERSVYSNSDGQSRELFLSEFSYGVNSARLRLALGRARENRRQETPLTERLFRLLEELTGIELPRLEQKAAPPRRRFPSPKEPPRDLVFLWKQNDSDLYARRSDMVAKYLLRTGRVRRIIHFDAPIGAATLDQLAAASAHDRAHQGNLVYVNTVRRVLCVADENRFIRRTFLHRSGGRPERVLGRDLPPASAYPEFVAGVLREVSADAQPLLWTCPIVPQNDALVDVIRPSYVIADLIDDQRTFPGQSAEYRLQIERDYEGILASADAVFCNCEPLKTAFGNLRGDIAVVPNGAEHYPELADWHPPEELAGLRRPIIGYVGNLRDRVDLDLVEAIVRRYPNCTVLLVGSAHGRPEVSKLAAAWPNLHVWGARPFEVAKRLIRGFDIAIMPHLRSEQSDRMNPLKLYAYFSIGVPIVTTDVANIGDLAPYVNVARNRDDFVELIRAVLAGEGRKIGLAERESVLNTICWEKRVADIWSGLELRR